MMELRVQDKGIGIEKEEIKRIGKNFVREGKRYKKEKEGRGIGIQVVKGLVERNKGQMKIKRRKGEGKVVMIRMKMDGKKYREGEEKKEIGKVIDM